MKIGRAIRLFAIRVARRAPIVRCGECDRWFLRSDDRAAVWPDHPEWSARCPVCELFASARGEACAVFNDCQGVFPDLVFWSKREAAEEAAKPLNVAAECYVAPVQVIREPGWRAWDRELRERDKVDA